MAEPKWLKDMNPDEYLKEDYEANGEAKAGTTIHGIDKDDPDWLDKAAKKVNAAEGNDYVKLDAGLMTVNQLNWMLRNTIGEMTFVDDNNQLLWYNRPIDPNYKMLASRKPSDIGNGIGRCHPKQATATAKKVTHALRTQPDGHDEVEMPVPNGNLKKLIYHRYKRVEDDEGNYAGTYEWVQDIYPLVKYFCETTGQKLVIDPDATTGATYRKNSDPDAVSGASSKETEKKTEEKPDTSTGASQHE